MRNDFVTPFWKDALASLPKPVQQRYSLQMHAAERWELGFGALIELIARAWAGIGRLFHTTPTGAH
jgi:hypothetical protein